MGPGTLGIFVKVTATAIIGGVVWRTVVPSDPPSFITLDPTFARVPHPDAPDGHQQEPDGNSDTGMVSVDLMAAVSSTAYTDHTNFVSSVP